MTKLLSQLANLEIDQRPAFRAELLLPDRIDLGKPGAEGGLVDVVEHQTAFDEIVTQAGVQGGLVLALLADIFGEIKLDHALDFRSEGGLVDVVEHQTAFDEIVTQAGVQGGLVLALLADIFGEITLDHALDV